MLDFCPYDFNTIDLENLAYELVFPRGWTWEKVKRETVVGDIKRNFINENETLRNKFFGKDNVRPRVMLLEAQRKGGKNGFKLFKELIEYNNAEVLGLSSEDDFTDGFRYDEDDFTDEDDKTMLHYQKLEGEIDVFVDKRGFPVMYALPCCPKCHNRLPIGWLEAEDFGAVSLMARSGAGKTTLLYSMMHENWEAFQNLGEIRNKPLRITAAHRMNDNTDEIYAEMKRNAEAMCRKGGKCPNSTIRIFRIPPVFLNVQYNNHTMIVGIYDNAGENLREMDLITNPDLRILLNKIFAELYLFDPEDLDISLPEQKQKAMEAQFRKCEILSLEEQGKYQSEHMGDILLASEILRHAADIKTENKGLKKAMEVYVNHLSALHQHNCLDRMKEMYFLGIIIKSDLLENTEEIKSNREYDVLFDREVLDDMLDKSAMDARSELVQDMIKELRLFGKKNINDFKYDFGEIDGNGKETGRDAVSWHCISALGCNPQEGVLKDEYAPIRVAEPMVTCILKRISDNGWIE